MKTKIKSYNNEASDLHDKETPRVGSNYTHLAVITILSLKKMKTIIPKCFYKNVATLKKKKGD